MNRTDFGRGHLVVALAMVLEEMPGVEAVESCQAKSVEKCPDGNAHRKERVRVNYHEN